jgi:hypothetical protein
MARSAALNPASLPFFPGVVRQSDQEASPGLVNNQSPPDRDRTTMSSVSDYRSARSSPSPTLEEQSDPSPGVPLQPSISPSDDARRSPAFRHLDASHPYPALETRVVREEILLGNIDSLPESEDTPGPPLAAQGSGPLYFNMQQPGHEHLSTPPLAVNHSTSRGSSFHNNGTFPSSSPVSSLDSGSHFTSSLDQLSQSFDSQLTSSRTIHDIHDRILRCEYTTKEIQRDLGDIHRKVNLLLERSIGNIAQPEFKDPFTPVMPGASGFYTPTRPSMSGGIAPNQGPPSDDISQISQRLNTLTASVGQLVALQAQQHVHSTPGLPSSHILGNQQGDLLSHPVASNASLMGHGLPNRPDLRPSPRVHPPSRTWSAGSLDPPMRPSDAGLNRQELLLREKRRSVSNLSRRDSSGVRTFIL